MEQTIADRQKVNMNAFLLLVEKLKLEVKNRYTDVNSMDWGHIGSFGHLNNWLIDLVTEFDGDFGNRIRQMLEDKK